MNQHDLFRIYRLLFPQKCANLKKKWERKDRVVLKSGYSLGEAYGNLRKWWKGYIIAKNDGDEEKMIYYAKGIQKFECELGVDVEEFSHLGLCALSPSPHEAMEGQDEANDRLEHGANYDDAPNTNDKARGEEYEFDNYEYYVSSLPMREEPISKDEFYKRHN